VANINIAGFSRVPWPKPWALAGTQKTAPGHFLGPHAALYKPNYHAPDMILPICVGSTDVIISVLEFVSLAERCTGSETPSHSIRLEHRRGFHDGDALESPSQPRPFFGGQCTFCNSQRNSTRHGTMAVAHTTKCHDPIEDGPCGGFVGAALGYRCFLPMVRSSSDQRAGLETHT
jgi:hypothetical protein